MTSGTTGSLAGAFQPGVGYYRTWSGVDGKKTTFAGQQRESWNPFNCTIVSWNVVSLKWEIHSTYNQTFPSNGVRLPWVYDITDGFGFQTSLDWTSNDQLKLLEKLLRKVKSHDFNLAVNLGQMHQTVDLITSNLRKLGSAALLLKRGHFADAARQLGVSPRGTRLKTTDVSGRWLEMQYGWLPLLGDSFEAAKAFEAISNGPRTQLYRVSIKKKAIGNGSQSPTYFGIPYTEELAQHLRYECVEEIGFSRQLGLLDPLSVAWELMPWSFVIDWFIPIGSYLDLVNQAASLKGRFLQTQVRKWKAQSQKSEVLAHWYESIERGPPWYEKITGVTRVPMVSGKRVEITRTYSESLSVPFPNMQLEGAVHGRRVWNAISLAQQRFARAFR